MDFITDELEDIYESLACSMEEADKIEFATLKDRQDYKQGESIYDLINQINYIIE